MSETAITVSGAQLSSRLAEFPDRIRLEPIASQVVVRIGTIEIARTSNAVRLHEGDYTPTIYVPAADANFDALAKTEHSTFCPFKGTASYYTIVDAGEAGENAVWTYEDPFVQLAEIKDHLAFYTDRVTVTENAAG